jgi:hypothetical protein
MNKKLLLIAPLSMLALAACSKSETPAADADATKTADASAAPVKMPPPITAQETYRCADNTIVHIDFLGANEAADIRVGDKTAAAIRVSPEVEAAAAPADATAPAADAAKPAGPLKWRADLQGLIRFRCHRKRGRADGPFFLPFLHRPICALLGERVVAAIVSARGGGRCKQAG